MGKNQSAAARQGQPPAAPRAIPPEPEREPTEDFRAMQQRRLEDINYRLVEVYHTDPLERLGNYRNGEQELVRIAGALDNRWFAVIHFETKEAYTGAAGVRYIIFPKRYKVVDGKKAGPLLPVTATTIVNGKVLFVREFAAAQLTGKRPWRSRSPRQYAMTGGETSFLGRVLARREDTRVLGEMGGIHTFFGRKLSSLLSRPGVQLTSWRVLHDPDESGNLASIAEDDTLRAGGVVHLLLVFTAPPEIETLLMNPKLQQQEDGHKDAVQIQLLSVMDAIMQAQDQHTLTGFMLLARLAGAIDVGKIDAFVRPP